MRDHRNLAVSAVKSWTHPWRREQKDLAKGQEEWEVGRHAALKSIWNARWKVDGWRKAVHYRPRRWRTRGDRMLERVRRWTPALRWSLAPRISPRYPFRFYRLVVGVQPSFESAYHACFVSSCLCGVSWGVLVYMLKKIPNNLTVTSPSLIVLNAIQISGLVVRVLIQVDTYMSHRL